MDDANYILAPHIVKVRFDLSPAFNVMESIREINEIERLSGLGEWVYQTFARMSEERRDENKLIFKTFESLFFSTMPSMVGETDYTSYVDAIAARDPVAMRDEMLGEYVHYPKHHPDKWSGDLGDLTAQRLLNDEQVFLTFMRTVCDETDFSDELIVRGYALFNDPPAMQAAIVEHMRWMWDEFAAAEWERVQPMLRESIAAFEKLNLSNMTAYEAIRAVTTRDLRGKMDEKIDSIETIVFVPSAHIGPYLLRPKVGSTLYCLFGARLPRGFEIASSALSRSELLIRLNALADDTRLRILELLTQHEELCAQDIIEMTELSQSSVSRHLSQLSATGFITERRRDVAKCYALNTDRVIDTLRTLTNFLSRINSPLPPAAPKPPAAPSPPTPPHHP